MTDFRARFAEVKQLSSPVLWGDVVSRPPGAPPPPDRRPFVPMVVGLAVAMVSLTWLAIAFRADPITPGAGSRTGGYEFLSLAESQASEAGLSAEAPAGVVAWTVSKSCDVSAHSADNGELLGAVPRGDCAGPSEFGVGALGGAAVDGKFFAVLGGRAPEGPGWEVRVMLGDGRTATVRVIEGLWLIVLGPTSGESGILPEIDDWPVHVELRNGDGETLEERGLSPPCYECDPNV